MVGEYTERLPHYSEGTLCVHKTSWYIRFYFPGPDLRYKGTFFNIRGTEIESYIYAYRMNWQKYLELKKSTPATGSYQTTGLKDMRIGVGGYADGVCLTEYHIPIKNESELNNIISDLEWAEKKANFLMNTSQFFSTSDKSIDQNIPIVPEDKLHEKKTAVLNLTDTLKSNSLSKEKIEKKPDLNEIDLSVYRKEPSETINKLKAEITQLKADKQKFEDLINSSFKQIEMQQKAAIKKIEDDINLHLDQTLKELKNDLENSIGILLKNLEVQRDHIKIQQEKLQFDLTNESPNKIKNSWIKRFFTRDN